LEHREAQPHDVAVVGVLPREVEPIEVAARLHLDRRDPGLLEESAQIVLRESARLGRRIEAFAQLVANDDAVEGDGRIVLELGRQEVRSDLLARVVGVARPGIEPVATARSETQSGEETYRRRSHDDGWW